LRQIGWDLAEKPLLLLPRERIGWPLVMVWKELDFGGHEIQVSLCSSTHSDAARFRMRRVEQQRHAAQLPQRSGTQVEK
jgi:hypothetical protein